MTTSRSWLGTAMVGLLLAVGLGQARAASAVSTADRVNVRSRAGFIGEVVTQLKKDQVVTVLDTVTLRRPATNEPPVWLKIELPVGSPAWVNAEFVESSTGMVKADLLNLRSGPTYDHGIIHRVKRGARLTVLEPAKDGWLKVATPPGGVGYVPGGFMAQVLPGAEVAASRASGAAPTPVAPAVASPTAPGMSKPAETPAATAVVPSGGTAPANSTVVSAEPVVPLATQVVVPQASVTTASPGPSRSENAWLEQFVRKPSPASEPVALAKPADSPVAAASSGLEGTEGSAAVAEAPVAPRGRRAGREAARARSEAADTSTVELGEAAGVREDAFEVGKVGTGVGTERETEVAPGRWVRREGVLVRPRNIVAPSHFALKTVDSGRVINFVMVTRPGVPPLREHYGRVVILTGREYLDRRPVWRNIPILDVETVEAVR